MYYPYHKIRQIMKNSLRLTLRGLAHILPTLASVRWGEWNPYTELILLKIKEFRFNPQHWWMLNKKDQQR